MDRIDVEDEAYKINYAISLLELLQDRINDLANDAVAVNNANDKDKHLYLQQLYFNVDEHSSQLDALIVATIDQLQQRYKNFNKLVDDEIKKRKAERNK